MNTEELKKLVLLLEEKNQLLLDRERELADGKEELLAQKEELTAAVEELILKNNSLTETLYQLKQRNEELDQMLYRASHDLRTPVTSISGLLDIFRSDGLKPSQELVHQHMVDKIQQMNSLLSALTALSQATFDVIQTKSIVIGNLVNQCLNDLSGVPNHPLITFDVRHNGAKEEFRSDELLLTIVLKALIANSITFRDPNKRGSVVIQSTIAKQMLEVEIIDDGEGIPAESATRIFEMFFRASERSIGSGLGLYITKSAIERLQGKIDWTSVPGKTIFRINIPER